jgi:hypothetical protein
VTLALASLSIRRRFATLVVIAVVAACGPPPGTLFEVMLADPDGSYPLPVVLGDDTGLVTGVEAVAFDEALPPPSIQVDPQDPNAFVVTWLGGACDDNATLSFYALETGYALDLVTRRELGLGCIALGVFRGLRIDLSSPVDVDTISFTGRS